MFFEEEPVYFHRGGTLHGSAWLRGTLSGVLLGGVAASDP